MIKPVTYFTDPNSGRRIKVGSILFMHAKHTIGLVTKLYNENGCIKVELCQPCGRLRICHLDHDVVNDLLSVIDKDDEKIIKSYLKTQLFQHKEEAPEAASPKSDDVVAFASRRKNRP